MKRLFVPSRLLAGDSLRESEAVLEEGGDILAVGSEGELSAANPGATRVDLSGKALLPGCVSTHTHSFQYLVRGFGDDLEFFDWREKGIYRYSLSLDAEGIHLGALLCFAELLRHGTTTAVDFFYLNDQGNENAEAVIAAAKALGIRLVMARCLYDWEGAPRKYRETVPEARRNVEALIARHSGERMVAVHPAPHSPHGASAEMIRAGAEIARDKRLPVHIHVAEGRYEVKETVEKQGKTPLRWLKSLGLLEAKALLVHGCWLDEGEIALAREHGASLSYNPSSNMFLGDGVTPIPRWLTAGVNVTLGVDGGCSNNQASIFGEMRMCALLQKVTALDARAVSAEQVYAMGTANASTALDLPIGAILPGRRADFVTVALDDLSLLPTQQLRKNLVYALSPFAIRDVFVEGRRVVENGRLTSMDVGEITERVGRLTRSW